MDITIEVQQNDGTWVPVDGNDALTVGGKSASGTLNTSEKSNLVTAINEVKTLVDAHAVDYTTLIPYGGVTTNSSNNYAISSPVITELTTGMAVTIKINADSTDITTLNWCSTGAVAIKKSNGSNAINLKANGLYTLRYDGANFILQGEGASGNATASDLASGKTASTDAGDIIGNLNISNGSYPTKITKWLSTTLSATKNWRDIAYGNGLFIAIADNHNKTIRSTDCTSWNATNLPSTTTYWSNIAFGNGKFVVTSYNSNNVGAYSTDGAIWTGMTMITTASGDDWTAIAFGNGMFVAAAQNTSYACYSRDGINWTETRLPNTGFWTKMVYGNGRFFLMSGNTTNAAYSLDGITWHEVTLPTYSNYNSVAYGNGRFVIVPNGGTSVLYSTDAINWTTANLGGVPIWSTIAYGNGMFAIVNGGSSSSSYYFYSGDGINWRRGSLPSASSWTGFAYGKGRFVTISYGGNQCLYAFPKREKKEDLQEVIGFGTWVTKTPLANSLWSAIAYGGDRFVAVNNTKTAYFTDESTEWNVSDAPTGTTWRSVAYGNGMFVAVSSDGRSTMKCTNGANWTVNTYPTEIAAWKKVTYGNGKFVAVGYSNNKAMYSTNGADWTVSTLPSNTTWVSVTYGKGMFVAISESNQVAYSYDGINWMGGTLPATNTWKGIAYGKGMFMAIYGTGCYYSYDAINWTFGVTANFKDIIYGNGMFIAQYNNNGIYYSFDGLTWGSFTASDLSGTGVLAVGNNTIWAMGSGSYAHGYIDIYQYLRE